MHSSRRSTYHQQQQQQLLQQLQLQQQQIQQQQAALIPQTSRSLPRRVQAAQMRQYQQQQQQQKQRIPSDQHVVPQRARLPRSADPSPQRTARRLESLNELHGGPLSIPFPPQQLNQFAPPDILFSDSSRHFSSALVSGAGQAPHHHHQILYVCRGQCSGPQCDFTHTMKQCQSLVWMDNRAGNDLDPNPIFQSEVVAMTDSSLKKLDEKKQTLCHMKELLADKLESKQLRRRNRSGKSHKSQMCSEESFEDLSEASRDSRHKRRNNSFGTTKKETPTTRPARGNLLDLTAGDLLGKSHEELVLMLIHLRRQSSALNEAIDASRSELQNLANSIMNNHSDSDSEEQHRRLLNDLSGHIRDLEEKRARGIPIISLVDNMVKLGSLYRGPQDAPLSHRVRNIPIERTQRPMVASYDIQQQQEQQHLSKQRRADIQQKLEELYLIELAISQESIVIKYLCRDHQDLLERSLHYVNKTMNDDESSEKIDSEELIRQQQNLVRELEKVRAQLQTSQMKLDDVASQQSHWEHDILILRQQLQTSASRDMQYGLGQSAETLNIESELAHVHQQATELHRRRTLLSREIEALTQKQDILTNEIRPSPTGIAGAEPVLSRKKKWTTGWVETDLDSMVSIDRAQEVELQLKKESGLKKSQLKSSNQNVYVNTYEEEEHGYENFDPGNENRNQFQTGNGRFPTGNPYEDDVQTVHSEGVRSEMDVPPLPLGKRPTTGSGNGQIQNNQDDDNATNFTLGDISEADDRVKKFFGILPRDTIKEIKTVRMVKRDSKERSVSKSGSNLDDDDDDITGDNSYMGDEPPPPPLPRGNYQNLHDFLTPNGSQNQNFGSLTRTTSGRLQYNDPDEQDDNDDQGGSGQNGYNGVNGKTATLPKTNFKLGEYYKRKYSNKDSEKPGNGQSAHERLFGSSRETSMSPPSSPEKSFSSSRVSSSTSPITSPIFKSATAKAIIEEVGKNGGPQKRTKNKKRSLTITGSHPAVTEAINDHQARMLQGSARSRDDLDMEQALRPRGQNTPDVIRSALDKNDSGLSTIDNLFGAPDKIVIPERYIPDTDMDNQTPEERKVRLKKVDSIRRMLAGQSSTGVNRPTGESPYEGENMTEERKQREQLLELNHLIARQVMEKSRMVAGKSQQN